MDRFVTLARRRTLNTCLLALALITAPVWADDDKWTAVGEPSGGTIKRVVMDPVTPTTLYATAVPGIFKSTDSGATWNIVLPLSMNEANDIAIDPQDPAQIYAATGTDGIQKSSDAGATWNEADNGIPLANGVADDIVQVVVDPANEGTAYAIAFEGGIYKTTDGGDTWNPMNTGLSSLLAVSSRYLETLTIDPANAQVVYLGTFVPNWSDPTMFDVTSGLYKSSDGGQHWSQVVTHTSFAQVTIDPSDDQNVYAGGAYLYVSNDGGTTWTAVTTGYAAAVNYVLAVDPADSNHLWGMRDNTDPMGLYESTDHGANWTLRNTGYAKVITGIVQNPVTPATFYVSSKHYGLYKSIDGGQTWAESDNGLYGIVGQVMMFGDDGALYLGAQEAGVLKSTDHGASWALAGDGLTTVSNEYLGVSVNGMSTDPADASTLFAATSGGLFESVDSAGSWSQLNLGLSPGQPSVMSVAVDPENNLNIYAGTGNSGVYKSTDGGATWNPASTGITDPQIMALAVDPSDSDTVFAGGISNGLFVSHDGADSWTALDVGASNGDVRTIAMDPNQPDTLYVSIGNGLFKSTDGGQTWAESDSGLGIIPTSILIDADDSSVLFASDIYGSGVYVSTDAGATWQPLNSAGLQASRPQLARAGATVRRAVVGTGSSGFSAGSPVTISAVALDPTTHDVYGTGSDGRVYVYHYALTETATGGGTGSGSAGGSSGPVTPTVGKTAAGSGGGGSFSWLLGLALLAVARKRRAS